MYTCVGGWMRAIQRSVQAGLHIDRPIHQPDDEEAGSDDPGPPPEERQAATVAAIRCFLRLQLKCSWDRYASTLPPMLHQSALVVVCILAFLVDAPATARLGVWHLVAGWDNGVDWIDGIEATAVGKLP